MMFDDNYYKETNQIPLNVLEQALHGKRHAERRVLAADEQLVIEDMPWIVSILLLDTDEILEFRIERGLTLGRCIDEDYVQPHLDLQDYSFLADGVSRLHAAFYVRNGCVSIQDLGSTNGTFLNGMRLLPYANTPIKQGDEIELGMLGFVVNYVLPIRH